MSFSRSKTPRFTSPKNPVAKGDDIVPKTESKRTARSLTPPSSPKGDSRRSTQHSSRENLKFPSSDNIEINLVAEEVLQCTLVSVPSQPDLSSAEDDMHDLPVDPVSKHHNLESPKSDIVEPKMFDKNSTQMKTSKSSSIPLPRSKTVPTKPATPKPKRPASATMQKPPSTMGVSSNAIEMQFKNKKRRLDTLKRDIMTRQKPIMDLYKELVELKKKLDEMGTKVELEEVGIITCMDDAPKQQRDRSLSPASSVSSRRSRKAVDENALNFLKENMMHIPKAFLDFTRDLALKREAIIDSFAEDPGSLSQRLEDLKKESEEIRYSVEHTFSEQQEKINDLVNFFHKVAESSNINLEVPSLNAAPEAHTEALRQEVKHKTDLLNEANKALIELQAELAKKSPAEDEIQKYKQQVSELKTKVKHLETELENEKHVRSESKSRSQSAESKFRSLRARLQELESRNKEYEGKINELQKKIRNMQDNMRVKETQWIKEKEEYEKTVKHQESILNKMTHDRSQFETRVRVDSEHLTQVQNQYNAKIENLVAELEQARNEAIVAKRERETMQKKYEFMDDQLVKMTIRNRQASDLIKNCKKEGGFEAKEFATEKEAELYTELLATKVALRDYEDKMDMYAREKLRFIDTIEKLHTDPGPIQESFARALVKQEEKITGLEAIVKDKENEIAQKVIHIEELEASVINLQGRVDALTSCNEDDNRYDYKTMVHDVKMQLNEALKKSLEQEQKMIKYEHELDMRNRQVNELDNLLKVRDGLIGMLKAKKDDLLSENESLKKYANEVRSVLAETKDDLGTRTEMLQELTSSLNAKTKECQKLEKKIKELEGILSVTNEKRFKLQDTIGIMEKELQTTKAQINELTNQGARYETPGFPPLHTVKTSRHRVITRLKRNVTTTYRRKRPNEDLLRASIQNMEVIRRRLADLTRVAPRTQARSSHCLLASCCESCTTAYSDYSLERKKSSLREFIDHVARISQFDLVGREECASRRGGGMDLTWASPSTSSRINSILVARDVVSQSLSKIKHDLENSILLVSNSSLYRQRRSGNQRL